MKNVIYYPTQQRHPYLLKQILLSDFIRKVHCEDLKKNIYCSVELPS